MKNFCFTVDDNIRFFKEITESSYSSIFEHPYLAVYKRLHEKYGIKIQLNLFYENKDFNLSEMTDRYKEEWKKNSDWLKLSFHSKLENKVPYVSSGYDEVFNDCKSVHNEIVRFASEDALAKTTTIHYCRVTDEGLKALKDNGVLGLLGLYGGNRGSYQNTFEECEAMRRGEIVYSDGIAYAMLDIVLNNFTKEEILERLNDHKDRDFVRVMIHEQYFYSDYSRYQPDFEEKLGATFKYLLDNGFSSIFFEEKLK